MSGSRFVQMKTEDARSVYLEQLFGQLCLKCFLEPNTLFRPVQTGG